MKLRSLIAAALTLSAWTAGAVRAQDNTSAIASAPAYIILMQDFATTDCDVHICGWLGKPLVDGILALENKSRRKSLQQQLAVLRKRLPHLDLEAVVHAAFCRELMLSTESDCVQIAVLGPGGRTGAARAPANGALDRTAATFIVKLSVEYTRLMRFNELRIIAAVSEVVADHDKPMLYVWYVTPGGEATQSSPLEPPAVPPTARQLATDAHWFGQPSIMEAELRQAMPEIARMLREMSPYLPRLEAPARSWDSLPVMSDLRASGKLVCRGVMCKFHVLGSTDRRVWFMQKADAPVVMSSPLDTWK
jgi:hypothetical protein